MSRSGARTAAKSALRLYPSSWRARHGAEVAAILDDRRSGWIDALDLARGAIDAWLHPPTRSALPPLLALTGGALWITAAGTLLVQPVQPDWPGYQVAMLAPATLGVLCLLGAVVGAWLRLGDATTRFDRLAIDVAVAGHLCWAAALVAAGVGIDYGATTVIAGHAAALGTGCVGVALAGGGQRPVGALLFGGGLALAVVAGPVAWLLLGAAWSSAGFLLLRRAAGG